ncbi:cache domain-containing sensor histidine kinase [Paenibacillus gansuensis]|uniref:Sensor histidine kinase n=1 Tax=Paenibacillus gansuensis TaxID=306542 RepID=A0ABW5PN14_9BACL
MRLKDVYRNYFQNNLFTKIILLFSVIIVITTIAFSYFTYYFLSQSIIRTELDNQQKAMASVDGYLTEKYVAVRTMVNDIYTDDALAADITSFLRLPFQDYVKKRLDQYYEDQTYMSSSSAAALKYFKRKAESDPDISDLIVYSAEQQFLYRYRPMTLAKLIPTNASRSFVPDIMASESGPVSVPNVWIRKAIEQYDPRLYSIRVPINDKVTLQNTGQLQVYMNSDGILRSLAQEKELKGSIVVLDAAGNVIFDSGGRYYGQVYPYKDKVMNAGGTVMLDKEAYVNTLAKNEAGYTVVAISPKEALAEVNTGLKEKITAIAAVCILFAILLPTLFIVSYAKRTNQLIRLMKKVQSGIMNERIEDPREDELGQIARSFDNMLDELTRYIDRVYKTEIKQKHTELAALQARVNPHFLYNTLEVIRMRAVSQGASDVGEMIYSLSMLFKNVVQRKTDYTLSEEIEVCRLYLELFRIRYKERFSYEIDWDRQLGSVPMMKMLLQPLAENYIVHGLRTDRDDNWISIHVSRRDGKILMTVADNGRGMSPAKLDAVRKSLETEEQDSESFGLRSVRDRLVFFYGETCTFDIQSGPEAGTTVSLSFPDGKEEQNGDV